MNELKGQTLLKCIINQHLLNLSMVMHVLMLFKIYKLSLIMRGIILGDFHKFVGARDI